MSIQKRVAIIDNSIHPDIYDPVTHWSAFLSNPWEAYRAKDNSLPDISRFSHLIITGSEASILERKDWVEEEVVLVRRAVENGLSVLGSCYGHQLLALSLAGPESIRRTAVPEIGWIPLHMEGRNSFLGQAKSAFTFTLHFDEVHNLDERFDVFASTKICPVQAFQLKGRTVWGLQPHPEITIDQGLKLLRDLIDAGAKGREGMEQALWSRPQDSGLIYPILIHFLS
ncbi:MAG: type 1 glutamine amidotransferase [Acidobacteria bacterium]|nr:type 1 glutamine amidotransferase [Acidobacteriota bacterium]